MKDLLTQFAKADIKCYDTAGKEIPCTTEAIGDVTKILNAIIGVLGIVAVVVVIIGGVTYMTSSGDAGKVKKAKDTILYGCIGLIIVALSFAIVNFVIAGILA